MAYWKTAETWESPTFQVKESIHLPKTQEKAPASSDKDGGKKPDVDDLMAKLKGMPGMENIKVAILSCKCDALRAASCIQRLRVLLTFTLTPRCLAEMILTR